MNYNWVDQYQTLNTTSDNCSVFGICSPLGITISKNVKSSKINRKEFLQTVDALIKHIEEKGYFEE